MIDVRADSIIYQAQIYYRDLINDLVLKRRLGKALDFKWELADTIGNYLESLNYKNRLTEDEDITDVNYILECLIKLCELNQYQAATPIVAQDAPAVIIGKKGDKGDKGDIGDTGATGMATDFSVIATSITTVVDSFDLSDASAARWDYWVQNGGGAQRVSSILGHWLSNGSYEIADQGADDLAGSTLGIEFDIAISGTTVQLIATISSGTWNIVGSRYFIPNNGNGSGPISAVLTNGHIYIGNGSNVATGRQVSGVINITNTGVTTFVQNIIQNIDISNTAGILTTKLAALNPNIIPVTNGSGFLTSSALSPTTLGYVDISSSLVGLLSLKLTDPTTSAGDLIIRNALNNIARLPIGTANQVLTVSGGVPTWVSPSGVLNTVVIEIGDWDMLTNTAKTVVHGLADHKKIRGITAIIRNDADTIYFPIPYIYPNNGPDAVGTDEAAIDYIDSTNVYLSMRNSGGYAGVFDTTDFNATSYNRGWITIQYSN